jgi:hypothetical protein
MRLRKVAKGRPKKLSKDIVLAGPVRKLAGATRCGDRVGEAVGSIVTIGYRQHRNMRRPISISIDRFGDGCTLLCPDRT